MAAETGDPEEARDVFVGADQEAAVIGEGAHACPEMRGGGVGEFGQVLRRFGCDRFEHCGVGSELVWVDDALVASADEQAAAFGARVEPSRVAPDDGPAWINAPVVSGDK